MNSTVKRSLSGVVYVAVLVFCITLNFFSQSAILLAFLVVANFELNNIFKKLGGYNLLASLVISVSAFSVVWVHLFMDLQNSNLVMASLPMLLFTYFSLEVFLSKKENAAKRISNTVLGIFYIAIPLSMALLIGGGPDEINSGFVLLCIFIFLWFNDTLAFVFGSWLGKHKLLESVSPNKTIEGFIGGILGSLLAVFVIQYYFNLNLTIWGLVGFAFLVSVAGTIGDLFESLLKRASGIKDSGNIIPGHGGVLDRLDSFLFAVPFVYFYLQYLELI